MANWGLVPFWSKKGKGFFNAQGETADVKPAFRAAFKKRRGIVMVDWFYEWRKLVDGGKQPYLIRRADGEPLLFAGLWEGGETVPTATIPMAPVSPSSTQTYGRRETRATAAWTL